MFITAIEKIKSQRTAAVIFVAAWTVFHYFSALNIVGKFDGLFFLLAVYIMGGTLGSFKDSITDDGDFSLKDYKSTCNRNFLKVFGTYLLVGMLSGLLIFGVELASLLKHGFKDIENFHPGVYQMAFMVVVLLIGKVVIYSIISTAIFTGKNILDAFVPSMKMLRGNYGILAIFIAGTAINEGMDLTVQNFPDYKGAVLHVGVIGTSLLYALSILIVCAGNIMYLDARQEENALP